MQIRKMLPEDLPRVMEIYAGARAFMADHGNPRQWGNTNWPPEDLIKKDISTGRGYVCLTADDDNDDANVHRDANSVGNPEQIVGVFFYDFGEHVEQGYDQIEDGVWTTPETYGVVHRIAADVAVKGVGSFCINWAFDQCKCLRMDTHPDNIVMQNLLTKLGFRKCGIIHVEEDNDPRYAYERTCLKKE